MTINLINEIDIRDEVDPIVKSLLSDLKQLLPFVKVEEVGSTSIKGSVTKGDIDLAVFVDKSNFNEAKEILSKVYDINVMEPLDYFESYKGVCQNYDFGIQLCTAGDPYGFLVFRDTLNKFPKLLVEYNRVKEESKHLSAEDYRMKKNQFIEKVILENA